MRPVEPNVVNSIVYTDGQNLIVRPLTINSAPRVFILDEATQRRPMVLHGQVFGLCNESAYAWKPDEAVLRRIRYAGTPMTALTDGDGDALPCGDIIVAVSTEGVSAIDWQGKTRWKFPLPGDIVVGAGGEICLRCNRTLYALAKEDGKLLWLQYVSPLAYWSGSNTINGMDVPNGFPSAHAKPQRRGDIPFISGNPISTRAAANNDSLQVLCDYRI